MSSTNKMETASNLKTESNKLDMLNITSYELNNKTAFIKSIAVTEKLSSNKLKLFARDQNKKNRDMIKTNIFLKSSNILN